MARKNKKEHITTINPDRDIKTRVNIPNNKPIVHPDRKKSKDKKACRNNKKGKL